MTDLRNTRREYLYAELSENTVSSDPFGQFGIWLDNALASEIQDATAMALSTVSENNRPSSRMVLLKQFSSEGFDFYTNYKSKKGRHLEENPWASLLFFWPAMERQIRIEGKVYRLSSEESASYFIQRPRESRAAAWASPQSEPLPDRTTLATKFEEFLHDSTGILDACPPHWGGFRLVPDLFEFWQGRAGRLHDRIEYTGKNQNWTIKRLAP